MKFELPGDVSESQISATRSFILKYDLRLILEQIAFMCSSWFALYPSTPVNYSISLAFVFLPCVLRETTAKWSRIICIEHGFA